VQVIPRLFWFSKQESLFEIFKHIVKQFSFVITENESENFDSEKYFNDTFEKLITKITSGEESDMDEMSQDITDFPMCVNIIS
jgi:hypothetical protein